MKTTRIMNKIIIYLSAVLLLCSCGSAKHYAAFQYDNGDDYVSAVSYTHLRAHETIRRQRQMCIRDRCK
mgnify:CR=1 FL=1